MMLGREQVCVVRDADVGGGEDDDGGRDEARRSAVSEQAESLRVLEITSRDVDRWWSRLILDA